MVAEQRVGKEGFNRMFPLPGCGWGLGGKPCTPPCRDSSLPGPEEARSPVLMCTYPYTGSCHWKGSTGALIGLLRKWGRGCKCRTNWWHQRCATFPFRLQLGKSSERPVEKIATALTGKVGSIVLDPIPFVNKVSTKGSKLSQGWEKMQQSAMN